MICVQSIPKEKERVLHELMQKYLYEMNLYYDYALEEDGCYVYRYLPSYFTDSDRHAYFLLDADTRVGFALVNTVSFTGEKADASIAEFTLFPRYRGKGLGLAAAEAVIATCRGTWQLKFSMNNAAAARLWRKIGGKIQRKGDLPWGRRNRADLSKQIKEWCPWICLSSDMANPKRTS